MNYQQRLLHVQSSGYKLSESARVIPKKKIISVDPKEENRPVNCFKKKRVHMDDAKKISCNKTDIHLTVKNSSRLLNGKYKKIKKIGCGSFSSVFLCQDVKESKFVVIKEMDLETLNCPVKFFNLQVAFYFFIIDLE
jgi:hypothetical protein